MSECKHCKEKLLPKAFEETVHPACVEPYIRKLEQELQAQQELTEKLWEDLTKALATGDVLEQELLELRKERNAYRQLVVDALEDETEFDTCWDKEARTLLEQSKCGN